MLAQSITLNKSQRGNALLYVFLAVGLLAALTYSFVKGSRESYTVQNAARIAEEMYVQVNLIKSSVMQCQLEYIQGGGDLNNDLTVDDIDNPNTPYPIVPSSVWHTNAPAGCATTSNDTGCITAAPNDDVRNLKCIGAPINAVNMFTGANNSGSFLPPKPNGFKEWQYRNDANGVYIQIEAEDYNQNYQAVLSRLADKFVTCQADINYNNCGNNCFTAWIRRHSCP